jgi:hypothetical protein
MTDTSTAYALTAESSSTALDDLAAMTVTPNPLLPSSSHGCDVDTPVDFYPTCLPAATGTRFWLAQRGWEASMELPPLTRRNNGTPSKAPQVKLDTGAPGRHAGARGQSAARP